MAGTYLVFALFWILMSDKILYSITIDNADFAKFQTYKGLAFVAATALLIFVLVRNQVAALIEAKDQQKTSEALLKSATDNTGVGLVVLDGQRRYTFANRAYSSILGIPEDIVGSSPRDVLRDAYDTQIKPRLDLAFSGQRVTYELSGPKDPSRHYSVIYDPRKDEAGNVVSVTVIIFEITELRRSEEALRSSEQRLKHVSSATGEGIWDWSVGNDRVQHNAQWCHLLGLDDSYLEHPVQAFFDLIHKDDLDAVRAAVADCLQGVRPFFSEHRISLARGGHIWVQDRGNVVERDMDGNAARMVGSIADITARKAAEEHQATLLADLQRSEREAHQQRALQQSIFDCTPNGMLRVDLNRIIVDINSAFAQIFGYELHELRGKHAQCIYASQEDSDRIATHIAAGQNGLVVQPLHCMRKSGEAFPVQMTGAKLLGPGGEIIGYLGVFRDITLELARESALREKQRLEALGRLTGGIAHDFNNLLTVISGNVELMNMNKPDDQLKRQIREVTYACEMAVRLNQRLMTFARKRELKPVTLNLNTLVNSLRDFIHSSIGEKFKVIADLAASSADVLIDASEMENAIVNLALNARDAMPDGGELRLETRDVEIDADNSKNFGGITPGKYVRLSVSDTGAGMSPEVISRAFEPYFTTKKDSMGTGLGLTTIHGFVKQSGGHITLQSELGHGTTVSIYLPATVRVQLEQVHTLDVDRPLTNTGKTILVVEDQRSVRAVTCDRLGALGYKVLEAANGAEALTCVASGKEIDLVFSDIIMPGGISGFDLADRLRTAKPQLRILLTSGFYDELGAAERQTCGVSSILRKPYSQQDLAKSVANALG